jgi:hypothetical protein
MLACDEFPAISKPVTVMVELALARGTVHENVPLVTVADTRLQITLPTPDKESVIVPETATLDEVAVDPFDGLLMPTTGGVISRLTETLVVAELADASTAVPASLWLAPSVLTAMGDVQDEIGEAPGTQTKLTVAGVSFQPLAFGEGEIVPVIVGVVTKPSVVTNPFWAPASDA